MIDDVGKTEKAAAPARAKLNRRMAFEWQGPFENWSRSWVHKNFWRVRALFQTEEDALQECALIFTKCVNAYADKVTSPAWLMALYKTAVVNDWHTFARKDGNFRQTRNPDIIAQHENMVGSVDHNMGPLLAALRSAGEDVTTALRILADAPAEVLEVVFKDNSKEGICRRMRRVCGLHNSAQLYSRMEDSLSQ